MRQSWKKKHDEKIWSICRYVIVTVMIIFLLMKFFENLGTVVLYTGKILNFLKMILLPLGLGFAFAYLLYPVMKFLERHLNKTRWAAKKSGRARSSAVVITVAATFLLLFLLFSIIISTLTQEIRAIQVDDFFGFVEDFAKNIQGLVNSFSAWVQEQDFASDDLNELLEFITKWATDYAQNLGNSILGWAQSIPSILTNLLFAIIFGIYFLLDGDGLSKYWNRVLKAISSDRAYDGVHMFLDEADRVFSGYIRGQLMDALVMVILVSVSFSIVGVKFAVIIGVLTGIGNLIPYVGPVVAYVSTILICIMNGDLNKMVIALIVVFIIQTIDGNVINPKLLSSSIQVHPMLVIASLIIGGSVGGILGMLLAVPVAALIKSMFDKFISWIIGKRENPDQTEAAENIVEEEPQKKEEPRTQGE